MSKDEIINLINEKINKDLNKIIITFYEMKIKRNLDNKELFSILPIMSEILEQNGYKIYRTGQNYVYKNKKCTVESNELMVAIK